MNKNEFLQALGGKLKEELTTSQIEEHLKYYNDYINQEKNTGRIEQEVIDSLGDPILLARTILETSSPGTSNAATYNSEPAGDIYQEDDATQQRTTPIHLGITSGWGCLAVAIIAILVVGFILWLFGIVFKALTPILAPILMVLFVVAIFKQRR